MPDRQMFRGDTLILPFQVVRDVTTGQLSTSLVPGTPPPNKVPFNLTGCTVWWTVKRHTLDPDRQAVFQGNNASVGGVVLTQPLSGMGSGSMPPQSTVGFPDGETLLVYDVEVIDTGGNVLTVESGTVAVNPDVTRQVGTTPAPPGPAQALLADARFVTTTGLPAPAGPNVNTALVALFAAGSGSPWGSVVTAPQPLAQTRTATSTAGGAFAVTMPASPHDTDEYTVKDDDGSWSPGKEQGFTPASGATIMEDPLNPGTYAAAGAMVKSNRAGDCITWAYKTQGNKWFIRSRA